ncbi:hypothetical protein [Microbacterium sp.]|uniref:hypothetical protein n=1 Tax=Microbacterium sp. TaxID=51671 RepID=UPI0025E40218|nr:hypothetical protein [Microbacterium sp.]
MTVAAVTHARPDSLLSASPHPTAGPTHPLAQPTHPTAAPTQPVAEPVEAPPLAPTLPLVPRPQERFLMVDGVGTLWRAVAGSCPTGEPPLVERSSDGGGTWSDVTPRYLGITQVAGLLPFEPGEAELIAAIGPECAVQGLRTYTQGQFWDPYPEALDGASYVEPTSDAVLVSAAGAPPAPCGGPSSLSVDGTTAALVCGTKPFAWSADLGPEWVEVPATPTRAAHVAGGMLTLARASVDCEGTAVSTTAVADPSALQTTCLAGVDPAAPAVLAADPRGGVVLWAGETLTRVG